MSLHISAPAVVAADNLGYSDLPGKTSFLAYHLFGVDQAASIYNRINAAVPLTVIGTPIYESDAASCTDVDGFETSFSTGSRDRTVFLVFTDPYQTNAGATASLPVGAAILATTAAGAAIVSWNSNAQYLQPSGSQEVFRTSTGSGTQVVTGTYNQHRDMDIYYPDATVQRGGFRMGILRSGASDADMWLQHGSVLEKSATVAQSGSAPASSVTRIGARIVGAGTTNHKFHIAAFAIASALTDSVALAAAEFIAADVEARGINFWGKTLDLPV